MRGSPFAPPCFPNSVSSRCRTDRTIPNRPPPNPTPPSPHRPTAGPMREPAATAAHPPHPPRQCSPPPPISARRTVACVDHRRLLCNGHPGQPGLGAATGQPMDERGGVWSRPGGLSDRDDLEFEASRSLARATDAAPRWWPCVLLAGFLFCFRLEVSRASWNRSSGFVSQPRSTYPRRRGAAPIGLCSDTAFPGFLGTHRDGVVPRREFSIDWV